MPGIFLACAQRRTRTQEMRAQRSVIRFLPCLGGCVFTFRAGAAFLIAAFLAAFVPSTIASAAPSSGVTVTRATLKNGLRIVVLQDKLAPVVSAWMNYLTGSTEEPITGLAHAQEHMMFRGSKTLTASQVADTTAITGGTFNADTQAQVTQYFYEMPSQYLDIALNLEAARAHDILDTQKLWDQERGAITQEVTRDNSMAIYRLLDKLQEHVFIGTPYAVGGRGTVNSFKKTTAADLKSFYDKWYHPNNAIYVIAGNVDPLTTIAKVRAVFEKIPAKALPARKPVRLQPLRATTLSEDSELPVVIALVAYRVPGYESTDFAASKILNDVFNSQRGALFELVATGKSLQTIAQSRTFSKAGISLVGTFLAVGKKGEDGAADIKGIIDKLKTTGVSQDLVDTAKRRELAAASFAGNSVQGLATQWSQTLAVENRTPDQNLAALQNVTLDDVNRVLRTYYDNTTASVAIATPKDALQGTGKAPAAEDNAVVPTEHSALPVFARNVLANLRVPENTISATTMTLSNGIKLVVQPESITHTVIVRGRIKNNADLQEPAGKEGVGSILGDLFRFGTTTLDRLAFASELDKISATISAGPSFSLSVTTDNFDRGVALLADDELHPALPAASFAVVQQQAVGTLAGVLKSPDFQAQIAMTKALYPANDPVQRYATPESAKSVTLDDVRAYYTAAYRPDLTTIVVVGDVTPDHARDLFEKAFGEWKAVGAAPQTEAAPVPANPVSEAMVPAIGRIQSDTTLAQTIAITRDNPDYAALQLANTVLSEGFYASILYHDLRELHGYVYTVGSSMNIGKTRSTFEVNFGSDPGNVLRAQRLIRDDLMMLQKTGLPNARITRAKALVLGEVPLRSESYGGLASELLGYASNGEPLDRAYITAGLILKTTPEQLRAAMAKYIRPEGFARVIQGPGAK